MSGTVEALWTKRAHRGPMDPTDRVVMVENKGIETDANFGRSKRQVTIIEQEVLDAIRAELPDVEPAMRRANVMVSGIRLENTRDHMGRSLGWDRPVWIAGSTHDGEESKVIDAFAGIGEVFIQALR